MMETLRNLWLNWGWNQPVLSTVVVMVAAGIAWWIFGLVVWASTPKGSNAKPTSTEIHQAEPSTPPKESTAVTASGGNLNLRVGQMKGFEHAFDVSGTAKVESHIESIIGSNASVREVRPIAPDSDRLKTINGRARKLTGEIFAFLARRQQDEPPRTTQQMRELWDRKDHDAFTKEFVESSEVGMKYANETSSLFAQQFAERMASMRDELAGVGLRSAKLDEVLADELRLSFEIQAAAEELERLAGQVKAN